MQPLWSNDSWVEVSAHRRWLILLGCFAVVALVGLYLLWDPRVNGLNTVDVTAGSSIRIQRVSYGKTHEQINLRPGLGWLERFVSHSVAAKLQIMEGGISDSSGSTNSLGIFTYSSGSSVASFSAMVVRDDQGGVFPLNEHGSCWPDKNTRQTLWLAPVFPRQEHSLKLQAFLHATNNQFCAGPQFIVSNPGPHRFPEWTPAALPGKQTCGELGLVLRQVTTGFTNPALALPESPPDTTCTRIEFDLRHANLAPEHWVLVSVELTDATGNRWQSRSWRTNDLLVCREGEEWQVTMPGALPLGQAAWKIRLAFHATAGFAEADIHTVGPIQVPAPRESSVFKTTVPAGETNRVVCLFFRERDAQPLRTDPVSWVKPDGRLDDLFVTTMDKDPIVILMGAIDEGGHQVPAEWRGVTRGVGGRSFYGLDPPHGSRELTLRMAFPVIQTFDFIAKPLGVREISQEIDL